MNFYDVVASKASPIELEPGPASYFSEPSGILDPRLFKSNKIRSSVRDAILASLFGHLEQTYSDPQSWCNVWLAGSGVSYQWAAEREPADLDCLVGIDYIRFRQANERYAGLSDQEIAATFNEGFSEQLNKDTAHFLDTFELTFYVNVRSNIVEIRPYAAYNLTSDSWTVQPVITSPFRPADWESKSARDKILAEGILSRYQKALNGISAAQNDAARINAESALHLAVMQGAALFDDIHEGRKYAFSPAGQGYIDYANYRWQAGKASGIVPALKKLKEVSKQSKQEFAAQTYGVELPDTNTLIRRAITRK
jgi:hypothetical protein